MPNDIGLTAAVWRLLCIKKNEKESKKSFFNIASAKENDAILKKHAIKPVYKTIESDLKETQDDKNSNKKEPMSTKRKICFLLSFNLWIVYFAVFLWILPCTQWKCSSVKEWNATIPNIELTTNIAFAGNFLIFGYQNITNEHFQTSGMILAMNSSCGDIIWTEQLDFIPLRVDCSKEVYNGLSTCLIVGARKAILINPYDDERIWSRIESGNSRNPGLTDHIICGMSPNEIFIPEHLKIIEYPYVFELPVLNVNPKSAIFRNFPVPKFCRLSKLNVIPVILNYGEKDHIVFGCAFLNEIEFWTISKQSICGENDNIPSKMSNYIFNVTNQGEETTTINDIEKSCIINWSNKIICLLKETSTEIWRYEFCKKFVIKYIFPGYFSTRKAKEIAVITQNKDWHTIDILNSLDGNVKMSFQFFQNKNLDSAFVISGAKSQENDLLLVKTMMKNSTEGVSTSYDSMESVNVTSNMTNSTYYIINFKEMPPKISEVITIPVSSRNIVAEYVFNTTLFIAEKSNHLHISAYKLKTNEQTDCTTK